MATELEMLIGLKTEVLEIKEFLADKYLDKITCESIFVTKDIINNYVSKSELNVKLTGYAKLSHTHSDYITKSDFTTLSNQISKDYAKKSYVDNIVKTINNNVNNIHTVISSLDDKYAPKDNNYLNINDLSGYVKKSELTQYATKDYTNSTYVKKNSISTYLSEYVKKSELSVLDNYALKSDLLLFVDKKDLESRLSNYATLLKVDGIIDDRMKLYATKADLSKYTTKDEFSHLSSHVNSNDSKIKDINDKLVNVVTVGDMANYVTVNMLDGYVKKDDKGCCDDEDVQYLTRSDIANFITFDDIDDRFVTKNDISKYIPNYTSLVATANKLSKVESDIKDLNNLYTNLYYSSEKIEKLKSDLSTNYYTKSQVDDKLSQLKFTDSVLSAYVKKTDVNKYVNLSGYATKSEVSKINSKLIDYAKLTDIPNVELYLSKSEYAESEKKIYDYIDSINIESVNVDDYITKDEYNNLISTINKKDNETKTYINSKLKNYVSIASVDDMVKNIVANKSAEIIEKFIYNDNTFITEREAERRYLRIEDYRYLKDCAVLNTSYTDEEKFYNDVLSNTVDMHNGWYVVNGTAHLVNNNTIIELEKINWKIEE